MSEEGEERQPDSSDFRRPSSDRPTEQRGWSKQLENERQQRNDQRNTERTGSPAQDDDDDDNRGNRW